MNVDARGQVAKKPTNGRPITEFEWDEEYWAASVSPSGVKQVIEYIGKQEEHHKTKTLESELEIFDKFKESLA